MRTTRLTIITCLTAALLTTPVRAQQADSALSPRQTVEAYYAALTAGDSAGVRATIGSSLYMWNGSFSTDPTEWQPHAYIRADQLEGWLGWFIRNAGPHAVDATFVVEHVRGRSALVTFRETGQNKFRAWRDQLVVWLLGEEADGWKILGYFIPNERNPS